MVHLFCSNKSWFSLLIILAALMISCISLANSDKDINNDINLFIRVVEPLKTKDKPMKLELSFECSQGVFRIYKHPTFGIAVAIGPKDWLIFEIISPQGIVLKDYGAHVPGPKRPYKGDHIDVTPGTPYKETVNLFPSRFDNSALWPETGDYRLRAIYSFKYKNEWKYGRDLWQGRIESNWVTIKVR